MRWGSKYVQVSSVVSGHSLTSLRCFFVKFQCTARLPSSFFPDEASETEQGKMQVNALRVCLRPSAGQSLKNGAGQKCRSLLCAFTFSRAPYRKGNKEGQDDRCQQKQEGSLEGMRPVIDHPCQHRGKGREQGVRGDQGKVSGIPGPSVKVRYERRADRGYAAVGKTAGDKPEDQQRKSISPYCEEQHYGFFFVPLLSFLLCSPASPPAICPSACLPVRPVRFFLPSIVF